jgi:hypothetical protein
MTTPRDPSEYDDDLFAPSLTQSERHHPSEGDRPWRLTSLFYVAFFGGPLAVGAIGYLNGKRLGLPGKRQGASLAIGVAGFLAALAVAVAFVDTEAGRGPRLMIAVAGVAAFAGIRELQKDADRLYAVKLDDEVAYDSLWAPGFAAVLVFGIFSVVVLASVT